MQDFLVFIARHWWLAGLFIVAFAWVIVEEARHQGMGGARQSPEGAVMLINRENAVVVDLRDTTVFKAGHIANSINIPFAQLDQSINKLIKYKQSPLIFACAVGQHSVQAMHKLKKAGFEQLFLLAGGVSAWKKANMPLKK